MKGQCKCHHYCQSQSHCQRPCKSRPSCSEPCQQPHNPYPPQQSCNPYPPQTSRPSETGRYTEFGALDAHALYVFQSATASLVGVTYEPICVRTQIVNGTNYNYIARATLVTDTPTSYYVMMNVYEAPASMGGTIKLGEIKPIA